MVISLLSIFSQTQSYFCPVLCTYASAVHHLPMAAYCKYHPHLTLKSANLLECWLLAMLTNCHYPGLEFPSISKRKWFLFNEHWKKWDENMFNGMVKPFISLNPIMSSEKTTVGSRNRNYQESPPVNQFKISFQIIPLFICPSLPNVWNTFYLLNWQ